MSFAVAVAFCCGTLFGAETGATLYKERCAGCHGPDGKGQTSMAKAMRAGDLTAPSVQNMSDQEMNDLISKGKNKMPAFSGKLSNEQIVSLVKYIKTLK